MINDKMFRAIKIKSFFESLTGWMFFATLLNPILTIWINTPLMWKLDFTFAGLFLFSFVMYWMSKTKVKELSPENQIKNAINDYAKEVIKSVKKGNP